VTSRDALLFAFFLAAGGGIALYCSYAAVRDLRRGVAEGQGTFYDRSSEPFFFWVTIVSDAFGALIGFLLSLAGLLGLATWLS
jgi:hypothetical protein